MCCGTGLVLILFVCSLTIPFFSPLLYVYLFPNPRQRFAFGSGLGLSRCLGPGECLHSSSVLKFCTFKLLSSLMNS